MDQEMQQIKAFANGNPFAKMLKIQVTRLEKGQGESTIEITVAAEHLNPQGTLHGGVISSMADIAMGAALRTMGKVGVTVNLNVNFLAPGQLGERIRARGKVVHNGNTMVSTECTVESDKGVLAKASGLWFVIDKAD